MSLKRVFALAVGGLVLVAVLLVGPALLRSTLPPVAAPPGGLPVVSATPLDFNFTPTLGPDPAVESQALPLQVDPSVCIAPVTTPAPQGVALPYPARGVIGGGKVQNRDFTFNIWLYCDESLRPEDMEHFSDLSGLGVYARWTYHGPKIEGEFWDMMGVDPQVRMLTGSPMQNGSGASMGMGLQLPKGPAEMALSGEAIRFMVTVQSVDGVYGAELAFRLKTGENGYIPYDIDLRTLPVESLASQPEIKTPEAQKLPLVETSIALYQATNGGIAFSTGGSDQLEIEIYSIQADGSGLVNLTNHPAIDSYPVWSPDGRQIAFLSDRRGGGGMDVYVMNADGSQPRLVYALPAQSPEPEGRQAGETPGIFWLSWSPDGQYILAEARLAHVSQGALGEKCLVIARVDGEGGMCVSNLDFTAPQWSPDGNYISYAKHLNQIERIIVALDVAALFTEDIRQERPIYSEDGWQISSQAQWSPNGQYLAVNVVNDITRKGSLWVGPASGSGGELIADLGSPYDIWFSGGLGSTDSTRVMAIDGADVIPAWSPDAAWIAFSGQGMLRVIHPDGSGQADLLDVDVLQTVSWSPDGRYILFTAGEESQAYLLDFTAALADPGRVLAVPLEVDPDLYPWFFAWQPVFP